MNLDKFFSYEAAVVSLALSFCIASLSGSLSEVFHFHLSSMHTAATMYLPVLLTLGIFMAINHKAETPFLNARGVILLAFLCMFWIINYVFDVNQVPKSSLSPFDGKRVWFFVHGVLISGFIGLHVPNGVRRFIPPFLTAFCVFSTLSSASYLLTYQPGVSFERLLGDRALGAGLTACYGIASCLALLFLRMTGDRRVPGRLLVVLTGAILIDVAAIVLSATRGAAISAVASVVLFVWMARRSKALLPSIALLLLPFICLAPLMKPYLPEANMERMLMKEHGADLRWELTRTMLDMLAEYPYGKVLGYENTKLGMDYSHNALLQYIGEAGVLQTVPVLLVLAYGVVRNWVVLRADLHVRALTLFAAPILIESCSAGSAYDSILWFLIFFVFALREDRWDVTSVEEIQPYMAIDAAPGSQAFGGLHP